MKKSILAIGAHPDDIELGCAGTLLKMIDKGYDVYLYIATYGQAGGNSETRIAEQNYIKTLMNPKDIIWAKFEDRYIPHNYDTVESIEWAIDKINPYIIFTHYLQDSHQDHMAIAKATLSAARHRGNILQYESPTSLGFVPTIYINIESHLEDKLSILDSYHSQKERNLSRNALKIAEFRGLEAKVRYAEAFNALRLIMEV